VIAVSTFTYRPARDELAYTFGGRLPVAHVRSGDILEVHTEDCFGGLVRGPADLPSQVCRMPYLNPVSGPFFVEDAEPGDTLAVHITSIDPARDWGVSATFPYFGALTSTSHTATLQALGIKIDIANVLPDVVIADIGAEPVQFWIIEAVATDGPVSTERRKALLAWAAQQNIKADRCSFLTAFLSRNASAAKRRLKDLASGTWAWYADEPGNELAWYKLMPDADDL
jgi:hypothetical protein